MKSTISELKKKLYEQQIRAKGLYTFEEYKDMRNVLQTLRMKFAAYEEWDLYQCDRFDGQHSLEKQLEQPGGLIVESLKKHLGRGV
ncbi:hypothetical protein [Bacillus licheniformis]|uniref:hypothetical protein n=1 Tax=Bacillus licheniformis TaxID=1402 RepID=UPI003C130370